MDYITIPEKQVPVKYDVDLLVCGGGVAGFGAAISAARMGARVFMIERYGFLGNSRVLSELLERPPNRFDDFVERFVSDV